MTGKLTHLDEDGHATMVDIGDKRETVRHAAAACLIVMRPETLAMVTAGTAPKGDVLAAARIAGIMAAKRTADLIPLCHPLSLSRVSVALTPEPSGIAVRVDVETTDRTGVEMEALTAASIAALTIYDMCKAADRAMRIDNLRVIEKSGGRSGAFSQP